MHEILELSWQVAAGTVTRRLASAATRAALGYGGGSDHPFRARVHTRETGEMRTGTAWEGGHVGTRDARSDGLASGRGRHEALRERVDEVEHAVCVEEGWTIEGERALAKICSLRREGDI